MTTFHFSLFLALAGLLQPLQAAGPAQLPLPKRAEIVRIVSQANDIAAQAEAKAWLERNRHDMADMAKKLVAAGFTQEEEGQPYPGCGAYTYVGKREATEKDISASFVVCPGRPPVAMVFTLLPFDKNPKGPLPLITPPVPKEGKK